MTKFTKLLSNLSPDDLPSVGATNIAKSQTIQLLSKLHIPMPGGWIITTDSFRHFIASTDLHEIISHNLAGLKVKNRTDLMDRSAIIRRAIESTPFPKDLDKAIDKAFQDAKIRFGKDCQFSTSISVIDSKHLTEQVVSLQQNLNDLDQIKNLIRQSYATHFSEQAFIERSKQKVDHQLVSIAINLYQLIRSSESVSGNIFTRDTDSNHPNFVSIYSGFGLPGCTSFDQYLVFKPKLAKFHPLISSQIAHKTHKTIYDIQNPHIPQTVEIAPNQQDHSSLTDSEIFQLAKWSVQIEKSYIESNILSPLQIIWAKDAPTDKFYIFDILPEYNYIRPPLSTQNSSKSKTHLMLNITDPNTALSSCQTQTGSFYQPDLTISQIIGIHPLALVNYSKQPEEIKNQIDQKVATHSKSAFYIDQLASNIAKVAASFYPQPVIVTLSNLTTHQYYQLLGGNLYEEPEINPLLGLHGTPRFLDRKSQSILELEILSIKKAIEEFGLDNIRIATPFCQTPEQGRQLLDLINKFGLKMRQKNIQFYLLAQTPANFILAEDFLKVFDGFIIDIDTLNHLTTGIPDITDQPSLALQALIAQAVKICNRNHKFLSVFQKTPSSTLTTFLYHQDIPFISVEYPDLSFTSKLIQKLEANN